MRILMLGNSFTSANNMPAMLAEPEKKLLIVLDALNAIKDALDDIRFEVENNELDYAADLVEQAVDSIGEVVDGLEQEEYELDEAMEESYEKDE